MRLVMGHGLIGHSLPRSYIALVHDLAFKYLRRIAVSQSHEQQQYACIYSYLLQYFLVHISIF